MQVTHTLMQRQLYQLQGVGLITWTKMPGSICVTPAGGKFINGVRAGKITGNLGAKLIEPTPSDPVL